MLKEPLQRPLMSNTVYTKRILLLFIENFNTINNYCYIRHVNEAHVTKISVLTQASQKIDA